MQIKVSKKLKKLLIGFCLTTGLVFLILYLGNVQNPQLDATRNSIQMVGQANFSHKELQNKSCNMIQDMLFTQKGINWNDLPTVYKRGSACIRDKEGHWFIDTEMPILKKTEDIDYRYYVDKLINIGE